MTAPSYKLQPAALKFVLGQTEVCEVRRIADHRLKPTVAIQDLAHRRLSVFDDVEGDHRQML